MFVELIKELTQMGVFFESLQSIKDNLSINTVLMFVMMMFCIVGGIDRIRGNKYGYGERFEEAFATMKPLALSMIGIMTLIPVLKLVLEPIITPIYEFFGASPAMFAGTIFAVDSGAYPLALELAQGDDAIANFSSVLLGSTFGCLILGNIPIFLSVLDKKDHKCFASAVLVSIITMPLGCIAGGVVMNATQYKMPITKILINLVPVMIVAGLIILGLVFCAERLMNGFCIMGRVMQAVLTVSIVLSGVQFVTGIRLPLFYLMVEPAVEGGVSPLIDSLMVIGSIAIVLTGAFPMVLWISRTFKRPIMKLAKKLGMNEAAGTALIATLASYFPALELVQDMNSKGRLLVFTFAMSGAFVFGDHLGFVAGVDSQMILPMIVTKLVAGVTALLLANAFASTLQKNYE